LPGKGKISPLLKPLIMKNSWLLLTTMLVGISCNKEPQFVTHENTTVEGVLLSAADRSPIANGKVLLLSS
jgi:hypothetical protein